MSTATSDRTAQGARRSTRSLGAVLVLAALTVAGYAGAPSASAYPVHTRSVTATANSGTAAVIGTIAVKASGGGSPDGTVVTLTEIPSSGDNLTRTTKADARGGYEFRDLAGGPDWSYVVSVTYQGTVFESDTVQVEATKIVDVPLSVYASTTSPSAITVTQWTVWVDTAATGLAVQQDVALRNSGTTAYTGSATVPDAPAGLDHAAFTLPVTEKADNFEYLGRFQACCSSVQGTTWSHTRPISPGASTGTLRYETPSVDALTFPATFATQAFTLIVPQSLTVSAPSLSKSGTSTDRGITYDVYKTSKALPPGTIITVSLAGVPAESSGPAWALVALVVVVVVVALVALAWVVRRRSAARAAAAPVAAPAGSAKGATSMGGSAKGASSKGGTSGSAKRRARAAAAGVAVTTAGAAAAAAEGSPASTPDPAPAEPEHGDPQPPAPAAAAPAPTAPAAAATTTTATGTRADQLTDELATLDLAWENGTITDEAAYQRIRESLLAQLVSEVDPSHE